MSKLVTVTLKQSLVGTGFAYGKGPNEVPEHLAAEWVRVGLAEYPAAAKKPSDLAETRPSPHAKAAEKRNK